MCEGVHNYGLSNQIAEMINEGVTPDIVLYMFSFNELSHANKVMTTKNSIGFPKNNDRTTSIGNLEYWINYFIENYPSAKMGFIKYPIKIAHNERSFFKAQFDYSLYLLGELYSIPICEMKNCGISFDENTDIYTSDGLHFNSLGVDLLLYPFIKGFLINGMSYDNEEPENCIGLYGTQSNYENYVRLFNTLSNVYGKKSFGRSFNGLCFYTDENTTSETFRFCHVSMNYNQLFGTFGIGYKSDVSTLTRFSLYGSTYDEFDLMSPIQVVSAYKTDNLKSGSCAVTIVNGLLEIELSGEFDNSTHPITSEEISGHTCLKLFTFPTNEVFSIIPKNKLKSLGRICVSAFSQYQLQFMPLAISVNDDNTANIYIVDGRSLYSSMQTCGCTNTLALQLRSL